MMTTMITMMMKVLVGDINKGVCGKGCEGTGDDDHDDYDDHDDEGPGRGHRQGCVWQGM